MPFLSLKKIVSNPLAEICGLDEAGRGPWAGPLVAGAVMFKQDIRLKGLKDSKQLTKAEREKFYDILIAKTFYGIGVVEAWEIDQLGLIEATNLAFLRALEQLPQKPSYIVVDGRDKLKFPWPFTSIIKGDEKVKIIACASILAKVTRDRLMEKLADQYPQYGFAEHKGYGTKFHQKALQEYGPCDIHRKSYKPLHRFLQQDIF